MDVIGYDAYPDPLDRDAAAKVAFSYDVMRSLRGGQPWLLMEQAPGAVNRRPRNAAKPRGAMRLLSWQAVAHGADAVMFFQWRQSRGGAEKFRSAMVPHGGPSTRVFGEVRELGRELSAARFLAGTRAPRAGVAMVLDWPSWWALEGPAHPSSDVRFLDAAWDFHRPLYGAEAVERFTTGPLTGEPAVTRHRFGHGEAWYLATRPDAATMRDLMDRIREAADVGPVLPGLPDGVQARARQTEDGTTYVVLNHGAEPADVPLPAPMHDELSRAGPAGSVCLEPYGVAVLRPA